MYSAKDFFNLRATILKNVILNELLIAYITKKKTPILVGKALIKLQNENLKKQIEESGKKVSKFIMVDIKVSLVPTSGVITYSYEKFEPVVQDHYLKPEKTYIRYLKKLSEFIFNSFPLNSAHSDKIFSDFPECFPSFLAKENIALGLWQIGFPKKTSYDTNSFISEIQLNNYYNSLLRRLWCWRKFNEILISLLKEKSFKESSDLGKFLVTQLSDSKVLFYKYSDITKEFVSKIIDISQLSPNHWENPILALTLPRKEQ